MQKGRCLGNHALNERSVSGSRGLLLHELVRVGTERTKQGALRSCAPPVCLNNNLEIIANGLPVIHYFALCLAEPVS